MKPRQQSLFGDDPEPWEEDDEADQLIAAVVFAGMLQQPFDYRVPDSLREAVEPGRRVRVPFGGGNRLKEGYCVRVESGRSSTGANPSSSRRRRLKDIVAVLDEEPLLDASMLRLTQWIAEYYLCGWGQVLETVIPAGVRSRAGTRKTLVLSLPEAVRLRLSKLKLPQKQTEVLNFLAAASDPLPAADVAAAVGCTQAPINSLRRKELVTADTRRLRSSRNQDPLPPREPHLELNDSQQQALDAILEPLDAGRHETILMHGVTGSGKTEVYIQAIEHVLSFGRQAIVLVPEISLTPQTQQRFQSRFGDVALLHSHLSDVDRNWHWERILRGEVSVVVGARSAVFAPTPQLGLIVMDEEHEPSFKQDSTPRYHARDVALQRAKMQNVPLVLGSATPSLESWHRASTGDYRLVSLPRRIFDRPLPHVGTIDLRNEPRDRFSRGAISRPLRLAMEKALGEGGQVILFLNRRGFSTHIQCPACGGVVRCPSCDIALTHHRQGEIALCHYCEYQIPIPTHCPSCSFAGIRYSGLGVQRLEAEVKARFPHSRCLRMDSDSMQRPGSHARALAAFRSGEVRILLGTQMIAKGLDFPGVTLVGVINADTGLHLPDFRASERTFQLIVQVAGRTGRGDLGGRVVVQSLCPDHLAIRLAAHHDYQGFAQQELPARELLGYPPYGHLVRIVVRGPVEPSVRAYAEEVGNQLGEALRQIESRQIESRVEEQATKPQTAVDPPDASRTASARILGPAPCPLPKLRGAFRYQIHVQGPDGDLLRSAVGKVVSQLRPPNKILWTVDVDPMDMM